MKAQLEKLQAEISSTSRKTGISSATQLAKLVPKDDTKSSTPDVEWWDALILNEQEYDIGRDLDMPTSNIQTLGAVTTKMHDVQCHEIDSQLRRLNHEQRMPFVYLLSYHL